MTKKAEKSKMPSTTEYPISKPQSSSGGHRRPSTASTALENSFTHSPSTASLSSTSTVNALSSNAATQSAHADAARAQAQEQAGVEAGHIPKAPVALSRLCRRCRRREGSSIIDNAPTIDRDNSDKLPADHRVDRITIKKQENTRRKDIDIASQAAEKGGGDKGTDSKTKKRRKGWSWSFRFTIGRVTIIEAWGWFQW